MDKYVAGLGFTVFALVASAAEPPADGGAKEKDAAAIAYKLTPTYLRETERRSAFDINLRGSSGPHTFWIGHYQRGTEFQQSRLGYEHELEIPSGRIVAGGQYATRGFLGGAVTLEWGEQVFGILGFGRTNRRDYYNLDFDPNDALRYGLGWRWSAATTFQAYQVRDDRVDPGNRIAHFAMRTRPNKRMRLSVDISHKSGWNRAGPEPIVVRATGLSLTVDYDRYFGRIAYDPKVNFSTSDMTRFALGMRF